MEIDEASRSRNDKSEPIKNEKRGTRSYEFYIIVIM